MSCVGGATLVKYFFKQKDSNSKYQLPTKTFLTHANLGMLPQYRATNPTNNNNKKKTTMKIFPAKECVTEMPENFLFIMFET